MKETNKVKILFLIHDLGRGGAEKVLVNLVNNMDQKKFDITVMSLFGGGVNEQFLKPHIKYQAVFPRTIPGNSHLMKLFSARALHRWFIKDTYDIEVSYLEGPSARIVSGCSSPDTKLVSWIHVEQHTMQRLAKSFRNESEARKCYDRFDQTICVSQFVKNDFCQILNYQKPCRVLYNTVESDDIMAHAAEPAHEIQDDGCIRAIAVGTLKESKGYERLLRIFKRLLDENIRVHLYILGEGLLRDKLMDYVRTNSLEGQITFLGYQTNPYKYVAKCDLFVCSSFSEGFSTAATESLIVGTPVCTVDVSGMKEMLGENNEYGVVTDNTEEALYQGIKKLLEDPALLAQYRVKAEERGKYFSTKETVQAVEEMLLKLPGEKMVQFEKIKLIIWDLDETFWKGTLSEENVHILDSNRQLIHQLTDIGIVNSICSKNDPEPVRHELEKAGLWDLFVFPSINWEAKGGRVKQQIEDMQLRPANVLFLDDNPSNREEVRYFCPEIMTEGPEILSGLLAWAQASVKKDPTHKRLMQYKVLEEKKEAKTHYSSNEAFLRESNIRVSIAHDCLDKLERIHDLNLRSNQLNFTKLRSTKEELIQLLSDPEVQAGYASVKDNFGDYGIVGFYAVKHNRLIHFAFSCRTLGMGVEQFVYNQIGRPELEIVGEVISDLSMTEGPSWINQNREETIEDKMQIKDLHEHMVLIKGPCDLFQVYPYIAQTELFDTEFTYTSPQGVPVESTGHTTHVVEARRLTEEQKQRVIREVPFSDKGIYNDSIFRNPYRVVFLSILQDANLGVYQRKDTGERFAFLEYLHPITDPKNWDGLISGEYHNAGFPFTREILRDFAGKYEFIGRNSPEQIVENLDYIRKHLREECVLVILLGGELYYEKNTFPAYEDRHLVHRAINAAVREWAAEKKNVRLLDVNKYLVDQSSFYDHFNHYIKPVYYALAGEMVDIVNETTGAEIRETSKLKMTMIRAKEILAPMYHKLRGH